MGSVRKKRKGSLSLSSSNSAVGRKRLYRGGGGDPEREEEGLESGNGKEEEEGTCCGKKRLRYVRKAATAPSSCNGSSPGVSVRGLKRKCGCVDLAAGDGSGKCLEDGYVVGKAIGHGKFGSVRMCWSRESGKEYACKTLLKNAGETVQREVEIMQHLSGHAGVVMLKAVFEDCECFHLVMEMCSGGRLLDQMAKDGAVFTEHRAAVMLKELVEIIRYCHEMGVVHRDIKPENILLTASGEMKLADFGLAMRVAKGQQLSGFAGTPTYVAPEVLSGHYSEKVDIWSAGILLHALLVGVLPFWGSSRESILEAVENTVLDFNNAIWEPISDLAKDLIKSMLQRDPSSRMTADQVLNHPWILFYTAQPQKVLSNKLKARDSYVLRRVHSDDTVLARLPAPHECSSTRENDLDESGLADMLAAAINRIRISEPKRIRLCAPPSPIQQECSSNLQSNLLAAC